jgi:hypothetical protein
MKLELRGTSAAHDFNVAPEHLLGMSRSKRFHRRLFGSESSGKVDRRISPALAVRNLPVGENAVQESLAVSFDCRGDARYIGSIEAKANDGRH